MPDEVAPRPPFVARKRSGRWELSFEESAASGWERNVLGGLKTKQVDVTVCKEGVGPVISVSLKGTGRAFRNITNRMEEMIGDCTNLHLSYPTMVYGFMHVISANRESTDVQPNDVAIRADGTIVESITRYQEVLTRLAGRDDVRDVTTKYESVALLLVDPREGTLGEIVPGFPDPNGPLAVNCFFERLYDQYDRRYVYGAPALAKTTRRIEWTLDSSIMDDPRIRCFKPRVLQ